MKLLILIAIITIVVMLVTYEGFCSVSADPPKNARKAEGITRCDKAASFIPGYGTTYGSCTTPRYIKEEESPITTFAPGEEGTPVSGEKTVSWGEEGNPVYPDYTSTIHGEESQCLNIYYDKKYLNDYGGLGSF